MNAQILDFPETIEEIFAACPECEGTEFYLKVDGEMHLIGIECVECGWDGNIIQSE